MRIIVASIIVLFGLLQPAQARHHGSHHRHHVIRIAYHHRAAPTYEVLRTLAPVHESSHAISAMGLVPGLAAKAAEIVSSCGSHIISATRPGAVIAGTNRASLHRDGRAVDIAGSPNCIYNHLQGWAGGYSVDYSAVQHVHISLGGREDGARFVHGGGHHHTRYASHRHYKRLG